MRCTSLVLLLSVAVAIVSCQRPVRPYRPVRRGPPQLTQRRDLAYMAGPPYSKRVRPHMVVTRPKKHISSTSVMGHPSIYSSVYKYPPAPHSRPYLAGPPGPPKSYNRPYGSPNKYPYHGSKPFGYSKKQRQPTISHDKVPKETIAQFHSPKPPSNKGTPVLTYNGNRPAVSYGAGGKKPFYSSYDSGEDQGSSEEVYGTQQVGASIKYGKTTPGAAGPAHPSLLDPEVNIKFPGPAFTSATHAYKTINDKPEYHGGQHHTETSSVVKFQENPTKRRRPTQQSQQETSQSTKSAVSRPYSTLKFPDSSESGDATSYQNYDHFLQETFAPDLTQQSPTYTKTKQQKKNRGKSRYRNPSHYEVKDESEERGDYYADSETVEDY